MRQTIVYSNTYMARDETQARQINTRDFRAGVSIEAPIKAEREI